METVSSSHAGVDAVPLTVLTGFLGAGKTTLLKRLLEGGHGLRVAVLVNDFGALNIDAELVVGIDSDVVSLANGCVCCSIRGDLLDAVEQVLLRPEVPQYIILEASGVAEPTGIAVTFDDPGLRERVRLDSIICVLDAEQVFMAPEHQQLKLWQIGCADLLVLNKIDLVDAAQVGRIKHWLDEHFHRYRLLQTSHCAVPLDVLLSTGRCDAAPVLETRCAPDCAHDHDHAHGHGHGPDHGQQFGNWSYRSAVPLSMEALRHAAARLPASIYRCKGVVYCADVPERRVILQVVGKRVDIAEDSRWGDATPETQIVAIGAHGQVDAALLQQTFDLCRAPGYPA